MSNIGECLIHKSITSNGTLKSFIVFMLEIINYWATQTCLKWSSLGHRDGVLCSQGESGVICSP